MNCWLFLTRVLLIFVLSAPSALATIEFPQGRIAVGPGEYYNLAVFGNWSVDCIKDENAEDVCEASHVFEDFEIGLIFDLSVLPYSTLVRFRADVDVVPRAWVSANAYSDAPHYHDFSVAILEVDNEPFDGFWCPLGSVAQIG